MSELCNTVNAETGVRHARKYESRNPVQRWLLRQFHLRVWDWLSEVKPRRVLDFGCGEGYFWSALADFGPLPEVIGLDVRADAIEAAQRRLPELSFVCADLFDYEPEEQFDLVVASEVLEHLYEPGRYLRRLCQLSCGHLLLTVPHEPFFRLCNLLRGRDLSRWGDHPEHVQHWSPRSFAGFVSPLIEIEKSASSFPFVLILGKTRPILVNANRSVT